MSKVKITGHGQMEKNFPGRNFHIISSFFLYHLAHISTRPRVSYITPVCMSKVNVKEKSSKGFSYDVEQVSTMLKRVLLM